MLFRRFALGGQSTRTLPAAVWGLAAILGLLTAGGCKTPWRTTDQPDFNRLIEIERQQTGLRSPQRDSTAARHRPGADQTAARRPGSAQRGSSPYDSSYEDSNYGSPEDEFAEFGPNGEQDYASAKPRRTNGPGATAAHASLSDQDDMEDMLVDVPAAQRDLLRREMSAMRARQAAPEDAAPRHASSRPAPDSASATTTSRARRLTDDEPTSGASVDRLTYAGDSKYQLAAQNSPREPQSTVAPRAVEGEAVRKISDSPTAPGRSAPDQTAGELAQRPLPSSRGSEPQRSEQLGSAPASSPVVSASYSQPAKSSSEAEQDLSWREHVYRALEKLEQSATAASPEEQVHRAMVDRLLHLSLGDINAASEPIDGLQTHGQDFIRHSLESLYEVTNPAGNPVEVKRYTLAMLSQRKALSHLAAVSNLEVRNATFCTEVDGFGVVTKFPQYNFKPDQELLLYCELDNFVSTHKEGQGYETQLQGSYEIVDASGRRIADQLLPMDSHVCRNQRRDYFIAYRIYMPQKIEPGKYQLKLTVEDLKGRKFGQSTLDFQIAP